jgi:hypothetical protein
MKSWRHTAQEEKMSKFGKYVRAFARDIIAEVIGWFVCIGFLVGAYLVGRGIAIHYHGSFSPDMVGLLFALALIWVYEHRNLQHKYDRLRKQLTATRQ